MVIDQADVDLIRFNPQGPPIKVQIQLDELPGQTLTGTIADVGALDLKIAPRELVIAGDLPSKVDESGTPRPLSTSYQARVVLDPGQHPEIMAGAPGHAKIDAEPMSLARRLIRYVQQTFDTKS